MKTIITQSETFRRALKFSDVRTGAKLDLTGCTAYAQMRDKPDGTLYDDAECSVDVENSVVYAVWDSQKTAEWPLGNCGYDIWLVCDGEQKPIFSEECVVVKGFTEIVEEGE